MGQKLIRTCDICEIDGDENRKAVAQYTASEEQKTYDICRMHQKQIDGYGIATWEI